MEIRLINGKWIVNKKEFKELTKAEIEMLRQFFVKLKKLLKDDTN